MWKDLNLDEMEKEAGTYVPYPPLSKKELEETIIFARLKLYNSEKKCGAVAIFQWMKDRAVNPIPSVNFISKVLKKNCLTNERTGQY